MKPSTNRVKRAFPQMSGTFLHIFLTALLLYNDGSGSNENESLVL